MLNNAQRLTIAAGGGYERILESDEVEDTVKTDGGDGLLGSLLDLGFGMESDAETGGGTLLL